MKTKLEQVIKALQDSEADIDAKYSAGVVDGFTEQPWA